MKVYAYILLTTKVSAGVHYKVTRFRGRWEIANGREITEYEIQPQGRFWRFILKYSELIPFVDTAYGIGIFQYPNKDTFYLYISDSGFILRTR
jgi:hypothetical protein